MTSRVVVLVGCGSDKAAAPAPARDLYTGPLFRKARAWAEAHGDAWYVVSAQHYLVPPGQVLEPYDRKLGTGKDELRQVGWWIRRKLGEAELAATGRWPEPSNTRLVVLAGDPYVRAVRTVWPEAEDPMAGLQVGERLRWLGQPVVENDNRA